MHLYFLSGLFPGDMRLLSLDIKADKAIAGGLRLNEQQWKQQESS
ncbi:hypothetical protein [Thalassomonas haliotis]|nr:hypothetical protein [Thalassomonas haliotis]